MRDFQNGAGAGTLDGTCWVKATASDGRDECVELAQAGENVAMRNSRDPEGPALVFTKAEMVAFFDGVSKGEFSVMIV
ncbi:DUF397 domain-containing protein [Streptomyces sp. SID4934]|uniref:DUF397 domain-containing protein n=1 Tax=unclassified Streptomyces TaxID=2593676 RepID=UPI000B889EAD|nr:DUF397 domain-containing protein [Streptomyces sp. ScaeMP-6W]MYQ73977.1 DUF397 domain-containing protein [Streptomyces sp. SID4934]